MMRGRILAAVSFLVMSTAAVLSGCSGSSEPEVLAIKRTRTYHRETCPVVRMAKTTPMTVAQANALHFTPCPACKPNQR